MVIMTLKLIYANKRELTDKYAVEIEFLSNI